MRYKTALLIQRASNLPTWLLPAIVILLELSKLVTGDILSSYITISSSSTFELSFDQASVDPESLAYHYAFKTNETNTLVLNISEFVADDYGGSKILVAVENINYNSDQYGTSSIDFWRSSTIHSWSSSCTGGSLLTSNTTQIHLIIYQLIRSSRFSLKATVCSSMPCAAPVSGKSLSSYTCLPAQLSRNSVTPRAFHSLVSFHDCYYTFGGISSISPVDDLPPLYSLVSQGRCGRIQLSEGTRFAERRYLGSVITEPNGNSHVFILGGINRNFRHTLNDDGFISLNPSLLWTSIPALGLFGHAACALSQRHVFVYGGSTFDGGFSSQLLHWKHTWSSWKLVSAWYGTPPPSLVGHSLTCSPQSFRLYVHGGFSLSPFGRINPNPNLYVFDLIMRRWSVVLALEPRFFHSAALLPSSLAGRPGRSGSAPGQRRDTVLAIIGGRQAKQDVFSNVQLVHIDCQQLTSFESAASIDAHIGFGASSLTVKLPAGQDDIEVLSSGGLLGFNQTTLSSALPVDLGIKMPVVDKECPEKARKPSDTTLPFWRCGLAFNPKPEFNTNFSRYVYDVFLPNVEHEASIFVNIDALADILSTLTSSSVEWTVHCQGWLRLPFEEAVKLAAVYSDGVTDTLMNFRFAAYVFVNGKMVETYQPAGVISSPSLPLSDPTDNFMPGNTRNGYRVSLFLNGIGPIIPTGSNIQLHTSTGAVYVLPPSFESIEIADRSCLLPSSQSSCLACLLNVACSWLPGKPGSCVAKRLEIPTVDISDDENSKRFDVIRDPAACPSCYKHSSFCRDCTLSSDDCTWLPGLDLCQKTAVTLHIPEATTTCPTPCFARDSCSSCFDDRETNPRCLWCESRSVCIDYWMAEAGIPTAIGCTAGCPRPPPTTPLPESTTICSEDKSWCGKPNELCLKLIRETSETSTPGLVTNPIDAFPQMHVDYVANEEAAAGIQTIAPKLEIDPYQLFMSRYNLSPDDFCSGHGHCTPPGRCACNTFWLGNSCELECRCYHGLCLNPFNSDVCTCLPGATGQQCESCLPGFTGNPIKGIPCRSCRSACNNKADNCVSRKAIVSANLTESSPSQQLIAANLSIAEQNDDIFCIDCQGNTAGRMCEHCQRGHFRPVYFGMVDMKAACRPCMCNNHSQDCNELGGGSCECQENTRTVRNSEDGCAACKQPFVGDPRKGRPCYLPVGQNQLLCLWQDAVPSLAAKIVAAANSSESSNICRNVRSSVLLPSTSMHLASHIPLTNQMRIFLGIMSGRVDVVMTLDPAILRPAAKNNEIRALADQLRNSTLRQKREITSMNVSSTGSGYADAVEIKVTQSSPSHEMGDSLAYITREQLQTSPLVIRGVSGRLLVVIAPSTDPEAEIKKQKKNGVAVFYLRITAVSPSSALISTINDDSYYTFSSDDLTGEAAAGVIVFRQDQVQIDVFVFFSVFLALFVLLLLSLLLAIRFNSVLTERRRIRARQRRKRAMIKRPFGVSWPMFDLPLLFDKINKTPMTLAELLTGPVGKDATPRSVSITQASPPSNPQRKTATVVSLQPTTNNRAAVTTILLKLPVSRPLQRQYSTSSGFNFNEQSAIVTQVPPAPMAFGTLIMRVNINPPKVHSGRKGRAVTPVKPGRQPFFERDPTDELFTDVPYPDFVTPPTTSAIVHSHANANSIGSATTSATAGHRRQSYSNTSLQRQTPSSITLPPTPDTVISTRDDGGDDLEYDEIDEILASHPANRGRQPTAVAGRRGRGRPMAAGNTRNTRRGGAGGAGGGGNVAIINRRSSPPPSPIVMPPLPIEQLNRDISESTMLSLNGQSAQNTARSEDSILIPELPVFNNPRRTAGQRGGRIPSSRPRGSTNVVSQRPPLPPNTTVNRQRTALRRQPLNTRLPIAASNVFPEEDASDL